MKQNLRITGLVISILAVLMPINGAYGKLFNPGMKDYMASHGLEGWTTIIGLGEALSIILFLIPKTFRFGALMMSALMGGAIVLHMSHAEAFHMQAIILLLVWIAAALRDYAFRQA